MRGTLLAGVPCVCDALMSMGAALMSDCNNDVQSKYVHTRSRRIVTLTHEFFPIRGGIATYVEEVARESVLAGRLIEVWAPAHPELGNREFSFPVKTLPLKGSQDWSCRIRLAVHLLKRQQEWCESLCYLPEPGPIVTWMYLQLLRDMPSEGLVITLHGSEVKQFSATVHRRYLFRKLLQRADRIGVVSTYVKSLLLEVFPNLESSVVVAPGAVRSNLLVKRAQVRQPSPHPATVLLTVARIHPRKGQLAVLEALSRLPEEQRSRISYHLAGPVTRPAYLRKLTRYARVHDIHLSYLGCLEDDDLAQAYADADIFIMTSITSARSVEGFGLSYLEASAFGLPIVAHRSGGVEEAVKHGESGIMVDSDDRQGLAAAIAKLVNDREMRQSVGETGRQWAARFSWEVTANRLFDGLA